MSTYSAEILQQRFTAPKLYNLWPQASLHTQWNGTGIMGDRNFDTYYSSTVEFLSSATYQQSTVQAAGAALLDTIGSPVHPPLPLPGRSHALAHCGCATETRPLHRLDRTYRPSLPGGRLQQHYHARLRAYRYPSNLLARRGRSGRARETRHSFQLVAVLRLRNPG
jgi:hypothetical protein